MPAQFDHRATIPVEAFGFRNVIGEGTIQQLPKYLAEEGLWRTGTQIFIVTDKNVDGLHGAGVRLILDAAGIPNKTVVVPPDEHNKNLAGVVKIWEELTRNGAMRSDVLLALGGGVVGDMAAFAASTYMRGISFVQVPTTLQAMVDSAIGGKTAIDFNGCKNNIGSFYQSRLVVVDPGRFLQTLPPRHYTAAFGEIVKNGMLHLPILEILEREAARVKNFSLEGLSVLIRVINDAIVYKNTVVEDDPKEQKPQVGRVWLNYGHTLCHAIEAATGYKEILHSEGVGIGMMFAAGLAKRLGVLKDADLLGRQANILAAFGVPTHYAGKANATDVVAQMRSDKKNTQSDTTRFVLPVRVGKMIVQQVDNREVERAVRDFFGRG